MSVQRDPADDFPPEALDPAGARAAAAAIPMPSPNVIRTDQDLPPDTSLQTTAAVDGLIQRISAQAEESVSRRIGLEERWLSDLQTFQGQYDELTESRLRSPQNKARSKLFVNQTRPRTNGWAARLGDMMFPTDDSNWGINPTPVPVLRRNMNRADTAARQATQQANAAAQAGDQQAHDAAVQQGQQAANTAQQAQAEIQAASSACENMSKEIEDQLKACDYSARSRDVIMDACKLGTGIMKGPMNAVRSRRGWGKNEDGSWMIQRVKDPRPEFVRVDPWGFFPDPNAMAPREFDYTDERHLLNDRDLRNWAMLPDMDPQAIREILTAGSHSSIPDYLARLRLVTSGRRQATDHIDKRWTAWEHHGSVNIEEMASLAKLSGDRATLDRLEDDPLAMLPVIIWHCQNKLLKFAPHPMDSGDTLYSVYNFEKDETSVFGFGVPYLMQDSQSAINAAWRMIMNNASLASGPQIIINKDLVTPQNGNWTIEPLKVWLRTTSTTPHSANEKPFEIAEIGIRQAELQAIIQLALEFADDETSMPKIAMGEQGAQVTKTAQGMAMLMNSVNVIFRRAVKNFDDQQTIPNIQRIYDWNMQFSPKEEIKGDYDVDAKGSSVLLVRELEAQNLMTIASRFANDPTFGPMTKSANLFRHLIRAHMLRADDIVYTDEEIDQNAQKQQQAQQQGPEMLKLQLQMKLAQFDGQTKLQLAAIQREIAMVTLSTKSNVSLAQIQAELQKASDDRDAQDRRFAAELAVHAKTGESVASGSAT